jgi:hypothetical protein
MAKRQRKPLNENELFDPTRPLVGQGLWWDDRDPWGHKIFPIWNILKRPLDTEPPTGGRKRIERKDAK